MWQLTLGLSLLALAGSVQSTAFSVGHGGYVSNRDGKIWFRNILVDTDGQWNQQRSYFECSDPGYYLLSFHGLSKRGSRTAITLSLRKNNRELLAAYGDGEGYNTASNSGVFYLNRRDKVALHVEEGRIHESSKPERNYITLSGFKIPDGGRYPEDPVYGGGPRPAFAPAAPESAGGHRVPSVVSEPNRGNEDGFVSLDKAVGGPH